MALIYGIWGLYSIEFDGNQYFSAIRGKDGVPNNVAFGNIFLCRLFPSKYANILRLVFHGN